MTLTPPKKEISPRCVLPVSQQFLESLIDQSPYPIWVADRSGTLIKINNACLALLDITEEEVVGIYNILQDSIVVDQGLLSLVSSVFDSGKTANFELKYDSSQLRHLQLSRYAMVILEVTIFPIKDESGQITHAVIQHIDITKRRQAEEALQRANLELEQRVQERTRELLQANAALQQEIAERTEIEFELRKSEEKFRTLCESAPLAIFMADAKGSCAYLSRGWERIFKITAEDCLGQGWMKLIQPEDRLELHTNFVNAYQTKLPLSGEYRFMTGAGKAIWCRILASPIIHQDGNFTGYVGTIEDITEAKQAGEEKLRTQRMESLGVLAGGIAHDFNNILTAVMGYLGFARKYLDQTHNSYGSLVSAEKASLRAAQIASQLLTFVRGSYPIKKIVNIPEVLDESLALALRGAKVTPMVDISPDIHPITADTVQLTQAFSNIIINAVQAMPDGGKLLISIQNIPREQVNTAGTGARSYVRISFTDEGCGISPENITSIFDPYFTTKAEGSGLGLASTHNIVAKHGGKIEVESKLGQGTTISLYLPSLGKKYPVEQGQTADRLGRAARLLIIDADEMARNFTAETLTYLGYSVTACGNGENGIEIYKEAAASARPFMAVIVDLNAYGMKGKEVASRILALNPAAALLASCAEPDNPLLCNYRSHGFSAALTKPYTTVEIALQLASLQTI